MAGSRTELLGELVDGRYRVEAFLARGGTSTVYRGTDTRLDRPVAIKVMDARFADDPEFLARFEREARSVARLSHPGLVAVHDQGSDDHLGQATPFLVMELVEGGTLRELLRERGPTGVPMALAVLEPVLAALAVAHHHGLVHRDVKPENVLVAHDGTVKVADFGLVRAVAAAGATSSGMIMGTAAYLSPEQVTTGHADPRSDVYSVGVLAFELLTGGPPYAGDSPLAVAYQHVHREVPPPGVWAPGTPAALDALVTRATRRDPSQRFRDAAEMAGAVAALRRGLGVPHVRVPAPARTVVRAASPATTVAGPAAPGVPERGATMVEQRPGGTTVLRPARGEPGPAGRSDTGAEPRGGQDFHDARRRGRRTATAWLVVLALVAAAVGAGAWLLGTAAVSVPVVAGLDRAAATRVLADAHLDAVVASGYDDTAPVDAALGTEPVAGARLDEGATVTLRVSAGRPTVPAPAPGAGVDAVRAALRAVTLVPVDGRDDYSDTVPLGAVLALDPAPGTVVGVGARVAVSRSLGVRPVVVPDVTGRSEAQARADLESAGLAVVGVDRVFDAAVDGGTATGTDVATGAVLAAGAPVRLRVSDAVVVPSVRGMSVGRARDALAAAGLGVTVSQLVPTDAGLVLGQSPSGSRVAPGTVVRLTALP